MKKTYILDTNVILSDPNCIYKFKEHDVVIPLIVIEELDNQKTRQDEVGRNSRYFLRELNDLRSVGNLSKGISLEPTAQGTLKILPSDSDFAESLPKEISDIKKNDNLIIAFAFNLSKRIENCIVVSNDSTVCLKCDTIGISAQAYKNDKIAESIAAIYKGSNSIYIADDLFADFYSNRSLPLTDEDILNYNIFPNQMVLLKSNDSEAFQITKFDYHTGSLKPIKHIREAFGIKAKSIEQQFLFDLLFDNDIKLVTVSGNAGTGKTLLSIAAGIHQIVQDKRYDKMIVSKPVQPMGGHAANIGFVPGTKEEKMTHWLGPIKDNLDVLFNMKEKESDFKDKGGRFFKKEQRQDPYLTSLMESGIIEVEALAFIRGRSLPNCIFLVEESQNLSKHEIKTILTRVGDNSKVILLGDVEQIDNVHVDAYSNGLTYAIEKFKDQPIAGHITLVKSERSELSKIAAQIL